VVEWDGSQMQTPVQVKTLNPVFGSTLYFPIKAQKITQTILEKKGPIKLTCFDWDESGSNDLLGKCELGLDKITSAFPAPRVRSGIIKSRSMQALLKISTNENRNQKKQVVVCTREQFR
jgi:Ca2+-dependent lipid-binding protein